MKSRVLIVDDSKTLAALMADYLEEVGAQVDCVHDGVSALSMIDGGRFGVVLLDLGLPDMPGAEVFREIKKKDDETEVIFLTGDSSVETLSALLKEGAFDYLIKPVEETEVERVVRAAFRKQKAAREHKVRLARLIKETKSLQIECDEQKAKMQRLKEALAEKDGVEETGTSVSSPRIEQLRSEIEEVEKSIEFVRQREESHAVERREKLSGIASSVELVEVSRPIEALRVVCTVSALCCLTLAAGVFTDEVGKTHAYLGAILSLTALLLVRLYTLLENTRILGRYRDREEDSLLKNILVYAPPAAGGVSLAFVVLVVILLFSGDRGGGVDAVSLALTGGIVVLVGGTLATILLVREHLFEGIKLRSSPLVLQKAPVFGRPHSLFQLWAGSALLVTFVLALIPVQRLRWQHYPFERFFDRIVDSWGPFVALTPFALLWFAVMVVLHFFVGRRWHEMLRWMRDEGLGSGLHIERANALSRRWAARLRAGLPEKFFSKVVITETERSVGRAGLVITGFVFITIIVGVPCLTAMVSNEGLVGLTLARAALLVSLVAIFLLGRYIHPVSGLMIVLLPALWFLVPRIAFAGPWPMAARDLVVFIAVAVLAFQIWKVLKERSSKRFIFVGDEQLYLGLVGPAEELLRFKIDKEAPVNVTDQVECYEFQFRTADGRDRSFHVRSHSDLELIAKNGPAPFRDLSGRIKAPADSRYGIAFGCAAASAFLTCVYAFALLLGGRHVVAAIDQAALGDYTRLRMATSGVNRFYPFSSSAALGGAFVALEREDFDEALKLISSAQSASGGLGTLASRLVALNDNGLSVFCSGMVGIAGELENMPPAERELKMAMRCREINDSVTPRVPPGATLYELVIRHCRKAIALRNGSYPEAELVLARALGRFLFRMPPTVELDDKVLDEWMAESVKLMDSLEGRVNHELWIAARARQLFRQQEFGLVYSSLEGAGADEDRLLRASAGRFVKAPISELRALVRGVSLPDAPLLDALLLARQGAQKEAEEKLAEFDGHSGIDYQALLLRQLVRAQAGYQFIPTDMIEDEMEKVLKHEAMSFVDLPWPEWMAGVDYDFIDTLRTDPDMAIMKELAGLEWYPAAAVVDERLRDIEMGVDE